MKTLAMIFLLLPFNSFSADLIDRIAGVDDVRPKIPIHYFLGKMRLYAGGDLTRAEAAASFDLQGDELTQANAIVDVIDSKGGLNKVVHVLSIEAVFFSLENSDDNTFLNPDGSLNKTKIKAILEIP